MKRRHIELLNEDSKKPASRIGMLVVGATVMVTAFTVGCASTPLQTGRSTSGIRAAEAVGADQVPQAALHLQLAKEELALAKKWAADSKKKKAVSMLTRAEADAELAIALSNENAEKLQAEEAMTRVHQLRRENE